MKYETLSEALFRGFAPDGGLYLPPKLPRVESLSRLRGLSFLEVSIEVGQQLFPEIPDLEAHLEAAYDFPLPLIKLPGDMHVLELFHGPTFSFKDLGARLLARFVRALKPAKEPLTVLVATSGDTGSAVGDAFYGEPGVRVLILYPKGGVTAMQEQQITTIGGNVTAVEVEGTFETCQEFVKRACLELPGVTTGNSINVARLLAHTLYYFYAYSQLETDLPAVFSIPCGNFGHLVAGVLAKRMGLPVARFVAATNENDEVPLFLHSGVFQPHEAYHTMSVSMDVGNPSNFSRLLELYDGSFDRLRTDLIGVRFSDAETAACIKEVYETHGYLFDPHSAIGYLGLKGYRALDKKVHPGVCFATAHPGKFSEALLPLVGEGLRIPEKLQVHAEKSKEAILCSGEYEAFKEILC